ncbi:MAG: 5'-nucleotidase [Neomegalonema sp.]|nr:5'-nucleotidase [Neomegalonema sp.]
MAFDLTQRLVVGVASSALFDLTESDAVFRNEGLEAFRDHQRTNADVPFPQGVAFPFVRRLLGLNEVRPDNPPVEVVLLSRNDADTGRRAFRSIASFGLAIERAAFLSGEAPHRYIEPFDCELFLSANEADVRAAIKAGQPAGHVTGQAAGTARWDAEKDPALRVAFDFDGVLVDDASERAFQEGGLDAFRLHEEQRVAEPHEAGPLQRLLMRLAAIQQLEADAALTKGYAPRLKTAIVTARGAPAHERVLTTLENWGVRVDQSFFLGGVEKTAVLAELKPHIFFDDQRRHIERLADAAPAVHVPFGVTNRD